MPSSLVGVNTSIPNRLVERSIIYGRIPEIAGYDAVRREVKCGSNSRLDLLLERSDGRRCFIEIKNCTLVEDSTALFPDAVTARGLKHLVELQELSLQGHGAVIFFLIQRTDAHFFGPADQIDPVYGAELRKAVHNGVQLLAYDVLIDLKTIALHGRVPSLVG